MSLIKSLTYTVISCALTGCLNQDVISDVTQMGAAVNGATWGDLQAIDMVIDVGSHVAGKVSDEINLDSSE